MKAQFSAEDIIYLADGRMAAGCFDRSKGSICTDTRKLSRGQWFLALDGEQHDGHDYIEEATKIGALGCIVDRRRFYPFAGTEAKLVSVANTREAFFTIARAWRSWSHPLAIAVTAGTRQPTINMLCSVIFAGLRYITTPAEVDESIAVPSTILDMRKSCQLLLLSMKPSRPGWLSLLGNTAKPQIAIIADTTHIDCRHVRCDCELLSTLDSHDGLALLTTREPEVVSRSRSVYSGKMHIFSPDLIEKVVLETGLCQFQMRDSNTVFSLPSGQILLEDAWAAIMCGREYGLTDEGMAARFRQFGSMAQLDHQTTLEITP